MLIEYQHVPFYMKCSKKLECHFVQHNYWEVNRTISVWLN